MPREGTGLGVWGVNSFRAWAGRVRYAGGVKPESVRSETESTRTDDPFAPTDQPTPTPHPAPPEPPADQPEVWTVDGIEQTPHGPVARLERPDGQTVDRPLTDLPPGLREGDLLSVTDGPDGVTLRPAVRALPAQSAARRADMQATLDTLNEQGRDRLARDPARHPLSATLPANDGEIDL
ncbi:hypothetical protein GCM10008959_36970 [Deinococcus seoulensis]|uniref:DUF3006 domain-containing protein n=1 Tax=Deinococcus seoulensis TaxID=1837379 RepID=A0ABQ2RZA4_9DEIO|nr:hypothetical protein GCM10008959_36970 [Deinococcus seoulensis]